MSQLWVVFFVQKKLKIGHLKSSAYSQTRSQQHLVVRDDSAHFKQLIEWWGVSGCCICMYLRCFMQMNVLCPRKMNTGQTIQAGPGCKASNRGKSWVSHCMYQQDSTGITFVFGHFFQEKACHKITTADHFWFLFQMCRPGGHWFGFSLRISRNQEDSLVGCRKCASTTFECGLQENYIFRALGGRVFSSKGSWIIYE